jgi:hypothetical protein
VGYCIPEFAKEFKQSRAINPYNSGSLEKQKMEVKNKGKAVCLLDSLAQELGKLKSKCDVNHSQRRTEEIEGYPHSMRGNATVLLEFQLNGETIIKTARRENRL